MRTLIDIPEDALYQLDHLRIQEGVSRAELIRRAIHAYLAAQTSTDEEAFGILESNQHIQDGLDYQDTLRDEW